MVTPLGNIFSADKKAVAQADLKLLGSIVEPLAVKFDQEKFEQLFSSGSISPKFTLQYRKVSSETSSQVFFAGFSKELLWKLTVRFLIKQTVQPLKV